MHVQYACTSVRALRFFWGHVHSNDAVSAFLVSLVLAFSFLELLTASLFGAVPFGTNAFARVASQWSVFCVPHTAMLTGWEFTRQTYFFDMSTFP